jgi:hypothetical protein
VASVLHVSPSLARAWSDPDLHQQVSVGDVAALYIAGAHTLVLGYLADVRAWCAARAEATRLPRVEHVARLSEALGAVAQTARDPHDRAGYVASLHRLARDVERSLADEHSPRVA